MHLDEAIDEDPEAKIVELYDSARDTVWSSTSLIPDFYKRSIIMKAIIGAADRVGDFHLLIDFGVDWEQRKRQIPWLVDLVNRQNVTVRKSLHPVQHWLVVDGRHFRLEKTHPEEKIGKNNLVIWTAIKPLADKLRDRWIEWWDDATILR